MGNGETMETMAETVSGVEKVSGRGGKRPGAGRPKGTLKGYSDARPQHQMRATDEEWELIKRFGKLLKKGHIQACTAAVELLERNTK